MEPGSEYANTGVLLQQARIGDHNARTTVVRQYSEPLARLLHGRLNSSARGLVETGDLVQEVLATVLQNLETFEYRGVGSFWGYLRRIALNRVAERNRRHANHPAANPATGTTGVEPADRAATPPESLQRGELSQALEAALATLAEKPREAVLLRFELGFTYEEIALECGYPSTDAARMAVVRALADLSRSLARFDREERA